MACSVGQNNQAEERESEFHSYGIILCFSLCRQDLPEKVVVKNGQTRRSQAAFSKLMQIKVLHKDRIFYSLESDILLQTSNLTTTATKVLAAL